MPIGGRCRSCTEPILFMRSAANPTARVPVELSSCRPDDDESTVFDPAKGHRNHFERCPGANKHRKKRK